MKAPSPIEVLQALDVVRRYLGSQPASDTDQWVDASACELAQRTVRKAVAAGDLEGHRVGKKLLVRRSELDRYIQRHRVRTATPDNVSPLVAALGPRRVANG